MVDVTVSIHVNAAPARVASIMFDPTHDPKWIGGAVRAEIIGPAPYGVGTRVRRHGAFLGRSFSWVTEVTEFEAECLVRMKHVSGPFTGGVDYSIRPVGEGADVVVRNYGTASFWMPFMAQMMRMSVAKDLERSRRLAEDRSPNRACSGRVATIFLARTRPISMT